MTGEQKYVLTLHETDMLGVEKRFCGDEQLYVSCLQMFVDDPTADQLNEAIGARAWDDAFTAAHALKGLTGNLGFVPLMHWTGQLVIVLRGGRIKEVDECMAKVNSVYRDITDMIRDNFMSAQAEVK